MSKCDNCKDWTPGMCDYCPYSSAGKINAAIRTGINVEDEY